MPRDRNAETRRAALERHIDEERRRLALFRGLVAQTASRGDDTSVAVRILADMETTIGALEQTRRANGGSARAVDARSIRSGPSDNDRWHRLIDESVEATTSLRQARSNVRRRDP